MSWSDLVGILKRKSIRKGWRKPMRLPVWVIDAYEKQHGCELVEVSPNGFRLRTPHRLPTKKELILRFMLQAEDETGTYGFARKGRTVEVPGEILWNRREGVGALTRLAGGRFLPMARDQWTALCELLLGGGGVDFADSDEHRSHGRLQYQDSLLGHDMIIRDVSESGAGLLTRQPVAVNSRLEIQLKGEDEDIHCRGRVVRCVELLPGKVFHVGLVFERLDKKTRLALTGFLVALLEKQSQKA